MLESSVVLPAYARCASVVTTGPNMRYSFPSGEASDSAPTSRGFALRDTSSSICVYGASLKVVAFSRVVVRESGRFGCLALTAGKRMNKNSSLHKKPVASFLFCDRTASSSLKVVDEICHPEIRDRPAERSFNLDGWSICITSVTSATLSRY